MRRTASRYAPAGLLGTNASITRDGRQLIVQTDQNGKTGRYRSFYRTAAQDQFGGHLGHHRPASSTDLGSLNGNTCFGGSQIGFSSSYGWALDAKARTAVGTAYVDRNGDGSCEGGYSDDGGAGGGEIVPFIWTAGRTMRQLSLKGVDLTTEPWHRAHAISGDGHVVLGTSNFSKAYAWIDEGDPIDLYKAIGALDGGYAMTPDGSRIALETEKDGVVFWNAKKGVQPGAFTATRKLQWCVDLPFYDFGFSCEVDGAEFIQATFGPIPVFTNDMSDDGKVMIARAGTFFESGFHGMMWLEDLGWIKLADFFRTQGVAEAYRFGLDGPGSINGRGTEMVGGIPGFPLTWYVDMRKVFICKHGVSMEVDFPETFIKQVKNGALMGRCEHQ